MPPKNLAVPRSQQQPQQRGGGGQGRHTILLIQPQSDVTSRTYTDHESMNDAIRSLMAVFEDGLRARGGANNRNGGLEYTSEQILGFVDGLYDVTALCFDSNLQAYVPVNRKTLKEKLYMLLSRPH
jgi:hypothetical protein